MSLQNRPAGFPEARDALLTPSPARDRIGKLFDEGSFVEMDPFVMAEGEPCGVICGYGAVMGSPACAFSQDGGGMGKAQSAKIAKLYDLALKTGVPVVGVYDSPGARVAEGAGALSAYGELLLRINNLSGVVPQISLVLGSCAGSAALLACSADFVIMSEKAAFFMTPPSLSKDSAEDAGSAKNAALAGTAHLVAADDQAACLAARRILSMTPLNNLSSPPACDFSEPDASLLSSGAAFDDVPGRALAGAICDEGSPLELLEAFGPSAYTALATMAGQPVGIVATRGKLDSNACVKIARLVSVCDAFQIPVVTLVNTTGFEPSSKAELCGSVREMAKLAHAYAEATTPKLSVVTARAYGSAYVALASRAANSDYTAAWPTAVISPLEPAAAVAFLHGGRIGRDHPREEVERDYVRNEASPLSAAREGHIDDVIPPELTRPALLAALELLSAKRVSRNPKKHSNPPM